MTHRDVVLRKIRALLQKTIANGCPLAEVLAAHAKAQALIDKHQVSHEELYGTGPGPRSRKPEPEPAEPKQQQRRQQQRRQQQAEPERAAEVRAPRPRELVVGIVVWLIVVVSFVGGFILGQVMQ
jgi:pyruvate/2-oxoglutarate dehydrogenase complex dihydrolipoamide acyltransferase (E2) component